MASLKHEARNVLAEARDAICWIAVWKDGVGGRSWNAMTFWPEYDEKTCRFTEIEDYELEQLRNIHKIDPNAIFINGYYFNLGMLEEMTADSLTDALRWHYEGVMDAQLSDALLSLEDVVVQSADQSAVNDDIKEQVTELLTTDKPKQYFEGLTSGSEKLSCGQACAYNAWRDSRRNGLTVVEANELPWGSDLAKGEMKVFVDTLREAGIDEIIVTKTSTSLMEIIHALVAEGATIEGVDVVDRGEEWNHHKFPGITFRF